MGMTIEKLGEPPFTPGTYLTLDCDPALVFSILRLAFDTLYSAFHRLRVAAIDALKAST